MIIKPNMSFIFFGAIIGLIKLYRISKEETEISENFDIFIENLESSVPGKKPF